MKSEPFHILTLRKAGQAHAPTAITIDWTGITEDQLRILARNALVHDFQARVQRSPMQAVPEKVTIVAAEQVHQPPVALIKYTPQPPKVCISKELDALLKTLSPEDLQTLLG